MKQYQLSTGEKKFIGSHLLVAILALAVGSLFGPLQAFEHAGWTPFSYPFNLTQQPACTIPCGLTQAGLPIGLQIVGPMFGDALVLRAARAYETVRPIARPVLRT